MERLTKKLIVELLEDDDESTLDLDGKEVVDDSVEEPEMKEGDKEQTQFSLLQDQLNIQLQILGDLKPLFTDSKVSKDVLPRLDDITKEALQKVLENTSLNIGIIQDALEGKVKVDSDVEEDEEDVDEDEEDDDEDVSEELKRLRKQSEYITLD